MTRIENPRVGGSIPPPGTISLKIPKYPITVLAQFEKRQLAQCVVSIAPCT